MLTLIFYIPISFQFLSDVNPDIMNELSIKHEYMVESKVSNDVFTNFINYWVKREPLDLNVNNIEEFNLLSHEFDLIKDQIQLFLKFQFEEIIKNKEHLKEKITSKIQIKDKMKSKQNQIINIIFNQNGIKTYSNYLEIRRSLYKFCISSDINELFFLVNKKVENDGLLYSIDQKDKTACLLSYVSKKSDVIIPISIIHDSKEYVITSIKKSLFEMERLNSIKFSENSELRLIEKMSFFNSSVVHLVLPASVTVIEKKAFIYAEKLTTIEFPENSQLRTIGSFAFKYSGIKKIKIPSKVIRIEEETFFCNHLQEVEFAENSELEYIGPRSFRNSLIEKIIIPSSVKEISEDAFFLSKHLKIIEFSNSKSNLKIIKNNAFCSTKLNSLSIPSCVEHFDDNWCIGTENLVNFTIIDCDVKNVSNYNNIFILGKSDLNKDVNYPQNQLPQNQLLQAL